MSKRVRTSRIANSKKPRRARPSGEREVAAREGLSSVDFDDRSSGEPSEAPPSVEDVSSAPASVESDRGSDVGAAEPAASLAPSAAVTTATALPETTSEATAPSDDGAVVPALVTGQTPLPPAVSSEEIVPASGELTPPPPAVVEAAAAPVASLKKKKKKRQSADVGGTNPDDLNASSGALSLNEPLARDFYESMPPHHHHDHDDDVEAAQPVALSPEILERKARLRRIVVGVFAAASLVVILVAGKTIRSTNAPPAADVSHATESAPAPKEAPKPAEAPKPQEVAKAAPAPAPEASAGTEEKKDDAKPEEKKDELAPDAKTEESPKGDPAELKKVASKLYNSGKLKDAIPALRAAIAADPDDALPYLFLGDALTNTGKWPDAKEAYNECVRHAKKGPKHECSAMGGRK